MIVRVFDGVQLRQVRDLQAALRLQLARLLPGDVPLTDAPAVWQAYDTIERLAAAAKTLLAARGSNTTTERPGPRSTTPRSTTSTAYAAIITT
jgi:hypothetical protein